MTFDPYERLHELQRRKKKSGRTATAYCSERLGDAAAGSAVQNPDGVLLQRISSGTQEAAGFRVNELREKETSADADLPVPDGVLKVFVTMFRAAADRRDLGGSECASLNAAPGTTARFGSGGGGSWYQTDVSALGFHPNEGAPVVNWNLGRHNPRLSRAATTFHSYRGRER